MSSKYSCLWKKIVVVLRTISSEEQRKKFPEIFRQGNMSYREQIEYLANECVAYLTQDLPVEARLTFQEVQIVQGWFGKKE